MKGSPRSKKTKEPSGEEIEYTPIRRRGAEALSPLVLAEDEISVVVGNGTPEAPLAARDLTPEGQESTSPTDTEDVHAEQVCEECDAQGEPSQAEATLPSDTEDERQGAEDIPTPTDAPKEGAPSTVYERVELPEEISLVGVLPLDENASEDARIEDDSEQEAAAETEQQVAPEDADTAQEHEDEEFVFTPIPTPIEYERVVLPDEISLVDVLPEFLGERSPSATEEADAPAERESQEEEPTPDEEGDENVPPDGAPDEEGVRDEDRSPVPREPSPIIESESAQSDTFPIPTQTEGESPDGDLSASEETVWVTEEESAPLPDDLSRDAQEESLSFDPPLSDAQDTPLPQDGEDSASTGAQEIQAVQAEAPPEDTDAAAEEPLQSKEQERPVESRFDIVELFAFTLALVLVITTFFFRSSAVVGSSMNATLSDGDQLVLYSFMYEPKVGDIVVFEDYSTPYREALVKRVIATEGQTVEIYDAYTVFVDGERIEQDFVFTDGYDKTSYPIIHTVAPGHIYVMGDHRNASSDSRVFGDVAVESVLGRVIFRYYPFDAFGKVE